MYQYIALIFIFIEILTEFFFFCFVLIISVQQLHAQIATENNEKLSVAVEPVDAKNNKTNGTTIGSNGAASGTNHTGLSPKENSQYEHDDKEECESDNESSDGFPPISPANMWTKPDIEQFKIEVAAGKGEGIIKVNVIFF